MRLPALGLAAAVIAAPTAATAQVERHPGIDAVYQRFVAGYAAVDPAAVAALYTDGALYVPSRSPARIGGAAIGADFRRFFDAVRGDGATLRIRFRIVERRVHGDAAWDLGYYHLARVHGDSVGNPSVGRFVTGLVRGADGNWRFVVDSYEDADLAAWEAAARGIEP